MSVIIKGMEMPKNCAECRMWCICECLNDFEDFESICYAVEDGDLVRDKNCPLVEIPTPHGRLIDADVFAENIKNVSIRQGYKNTLIDEYLSVDDVFDAIIDELTGKTLYGFELNPTSIEAEGSEE